MKNFINVFFIFKDNQRKTFDVMNNVIFIVIQGFTRDSICPEINE